MQGKEFLQIINFTKEIIINAENPQFLLGDLENEENPPFPVVLRGINLIVADAGMGKSLISRGLLERLKNRPDIGDFGFVYADYEFDPSVAKERRFNELLEVLGDKFILLVPETEEEWSKFFFENKGYIPYLEPEELEIFEKELAKIKKEEKLSFRQKVFFALVFFQAHRFIDVIVVVDSLEDLIVNTSDDGEAKRFINIALSRPNVTYIFNHHVRKAQGRENPLHFSFRGSQVWRGKAKSMLHIVDVTFEDDFTVSWEVYITKMRVKYIPGIRRLFVRLDTTTFDLAYHFNANREAVYILRNIYFALKQHKEMKTKELIEYVRKKIKKSPNKVKEVLREFETYFHVENRGKAKVFSLPKSEEALAELENLLGIEDSKALNQMISLLKKMKPEKKYEVEVEGVKMEVTKEMLEEKIFQYSSNLLRKLYEALYPQVEEITLDFSGNEDEVDLGDLDMDLDL